MWRRKAHFSYCSLGSACLVESLACSSPVHCLEPQDLCLPNTWFSWFFTGSSARPTSQKPLSQPPRNSFRYVYLLFSYFFIHIFTLESHSSGLTMALRHHKTACQKIWRQALKIRAEVNIGSARGLEGISLMGNFGDL